MLLTILAALTLTSALPADDASDLRQLARSITRDASTDYERARAIYGWIATNVTYDVASYLQGGEGDMSAEAVAVRRTAVCDGYANLFVALAAAVGVRAEKVPGYAKGFDHKAGDRIPKSNHAWVAFRIGRNWHLADPTWGSGHVTAELQFAPEFTWWYFDVDPELLILSHFPEDPKWQRLSKRVRQSEFERMATVPHALRTLGFPAAELTRLARGGNTVFPLGVMVDTTLHVNAAPLTATLSIAESYLFDVEWTGVSRIALVSGNVWTQLAPKGDGRFSSEVRPAAGQVLLAGETTDGWKTLLMYEAR